MTEFENLFSRYDRLVFFDTETTGLNYSRDEIIEFAAVVVECRQGKAEIVQEYDQLITLSPGSFVPPHITRKAQAPPHRPYSVPNRLPNSSPDSRIRPRLINAAPAGSFRNSSSTITPSTYSPMAKAPREARAISSISSKISP